MECEGDEHGIPKCPHLRPKNSSQDFDDITLEDNFSLSGIETQSPLFQILRDDFIQEDQQMPQGGKRSFDQTCRSSKASFQYFIQRPQKRPQKKVHR